MIHSPRSCPAPPPPRRGRQTPQARAGFTLLELLVVIIIISLLVALLFPAISGARTNVNVASVRTEITSLEQGLSNFKATFGQYPPSRIVLYEEAAGDPSWAADTADPARLSRSRGIIRTLWPQFDFTYAASGGNLNLDFDGASDEVHVLTGAECLVFFLGGVTNSVKAKVGFSKNPANPFSPDGANRDGPFFEFDAGRLNVDTDSDEVREYLSPLSGQTTPYLYVSSYGGSGYELADLAVFGGPGDMADVYRQTDGAPGTPWKGQTYQIICPTFDNAYGQGGPYDPERVDDTAAPWGLFDDPPMSYFRIVERDNITNFQQGMLSPN